MAELAIPIDRSKWSFTDIWERHGAAIITALCLLFILLAWWAGKQNMPAAEIVLFVLAYIIGGHQKAIEGLTTLFKERDLDVDLLMVVAAIGAASIGYWMDGAILIFIFSLSGALEDYTMEKTNKDIQSIMKLRPEEAMLLENGVERKVKVEALKKGDVILVRPGDRISADGVIINGYSAINEASITGEGIPVDKKKGDEVFSGTINGHGALEIEVTKPSGETILSKIIHLVQEAKNEKPPSQQFVERFEGVYAKVVVGVAVLLMTLPPYLFNWTWSDTIYRAMIFLVVASPCALVSSIMPAILSGISNAARKGILFKGGVHLENIGGVKVVAFDKTGTLTYGSPKIIDIVPLSGMSSEELLQTAASVETLSEHPIAKAIVREAMDRQLVLSKPKELQAIHGLGVHGILDGREYKIGKKEILKDVTVSARDLEMAAHFEEKGRTVIFVAADGDAIGLISVEDTIRPQAKKVIEELKSKGIKVALLTGDTKTMGKAIANQAGIDEVYSELLPEQKVEAVKKLEEKYGKVAMVGDGVNDAPALATASVGIAMGSGGTDVAMETADIILMADNIENIPFAINLGRRASSIIKQNIVFAIAVALTLVTLNFIGKGQITLPQGVVGHEGSTVLVILSGLRLLR
ncbi:cadmium-translocating P-type ATPase [Chryseobacterium indologenes]|uniref:Cadmium-translocating P-type ATPase n=1 Tax=Chryseobacterium indologenes TaxID=253 RepID=A0AAD0YU82_CHRID|nr:heavy metal translocating P-type ATPase [Chryseobacterium indologenes]AZB17242.1 cadmium-translocating P-type ATPase [Chryseobacterium indologenes]